MKSFLKTRHERGSALVEFAITLPLLVVFVVGIYDFSGAFNQKQKIEQAAQEGAIVIGSQPMNDIVVGNTDPVSLRPVVTSVFNSLVASGVVPVGICNPPGTITGGPNLQWTYTIPNCSSSGDLIIVLSRGISAAGQPVTVGSKVTVKYPYQWRFNSVIQLLIPGANYSLPAEVIDSAIVHNQT